MAQTNDARFRNLLTQLKPLLEVSLDAVALVNESNRLEYVNLPMKSLLGLKGKDLARAPIFCECLRLAACQGSCQILQVVKLGGKLRLDESPAQRGDERLRISIRAVPLYDPDLGASEAREALPIGALISARDTTGELLLQAKYHKIHEILKERDARIEALEQNISALRQALRKARDKAIA